MRIFQLRREQIIPQPLVHVFAFFERPENLARITPPWLDFRILTPSPILMKRGTTIEYSIRVLGVKARWTSRITMYEPPHAFVDEQIEGPYSFWHHTHRFLEDASGTKVIDDVRYALPLGVLGVFVHRLMVKRQLEAIFTYRASVLAQLFPPVENISLKNERILC